MKCKTDNQRISSNPHTQTPAPTTAASRYRTTDLLPPLTPFIPHFTPHALGRLDNLLEKLSAPEKHPYILTIHHLQKSPTHLQPRMTRPLGKASLREKVEPTKWINKYKELRDNKEDEDVVATQRLQWPRMLFNLVSTVSLYGKIHIKNIKICISNLS